MKHGRKPSGGRYKKQRKKKLFEKKGQKTKVKLGERKTKLKKIVGGARKIITLSENTANVIINGKAKKVHIKTVLETPSNRFLARQNILTKGSVIETDIGKAKITNRPSQEGNVQAVLIKE